MRSTKLKGSKHAQPVGACWRRSTSEDSAQKVKRFGLMKSKTPGVSHAMLGKPGEASAPSCATTPHRRRTNSPAGSPGGSTVGAKTARSATTKLSERRQSAIRGHLSASRCLDRLDHCPSYRRAHLDAGCIGARKRHRRLRRLLLQSSGRRSSSGHRQMGVVTIGVRAALPRRCSADSGGRHRSLETCSGRSYAPGILTRASWPPSRL